MKIDRPRWLFAGSLLLAAGALLASSRLVPGFWIRADRRGDRWLAAGRFQDAARVYEDPYRRGAALYRAGDFEGAAQSFSRIATPEAAFNQGNALVMLGKYADAIARYDRALALRPNWRACADNRALAVLRRDRLKQVGGDETGGQLKPDEIVYEKGKKPSDGRPDMASGDPMTDEQLRSLWLERVQTRPADFLRAKFAFQERASHPASPEGGTPP